MASKNFIKSDVNRDPSQSIYDINLFDNNFNLFNMFLTNFNNSIELAICSEIPSGVGTSHTESTLLIYYINTWTGFYMVGEFYGGYSQTDCNFNFNINVNVTADSYNKSSFSFSFSHLLKDLPTFRIMKLESTSRITT